VAGDAVALIGREPGPSFPSRHTASAVAMALTTLPVAPRRGAVMAALAAWMGLSRLYCGLHYPSDVLAGAALGALAALLTARMTPRGPLRTGLASGAP
jgi:undecaprenyl-diphosphatase